MTSSTSLSTFSSELGCQVLDPSQFNKPEVINAFHPDYMKTYHPDFTKEFRTVEANQVEREAIKKAKPKANSKFARKNIKKADTNHINSKEEQSKTIAEIRVELDAKRKAMLEPRTYTTYSKAGTANVTPKGKKK